MRVATGLAHPSSGAVLFGGQPAGRVRARLAAVFDDAPVYPLLTGGRTCTCSRAGAPPRTRLRPGRCWTSWIWSRCCRSGRDGLSFGQRKRLAVAAALLRRPSWLLLDEPSVGLDSGAWGAYRRAPCGGLRRRAPCIVVTGQDLKNLEELADEIVVIRDGAAVFAGTRADLQRPPPALRPGAHPGRRPAAGALPAGRGCWRRGPCPAWRSPAPAAPRARRCWPGSGPPRSPCSRWSCGRPRWRRASAGWGCMMTRTREEVAR